ncbi:RapGAP/RanGAP domain-containing protein [Dictyostelium discoideum AX4]|uniref:GTPase-activating protein DDB_G0291510 n=1 Tax=Dictyostelium discoideum TaxID=44689 RepID=Y1510_DICDI|nr:RapGAP/RanGAP domain-containing protein [Dictyostelium discoideum AX4]Q54EH3.1 RecName: Full=GTPase-activating protein DDB_G0291510 [Dictyostelium discoideum]EAL61739.1 RapGAP/RanGAP domain-containing protein [Dictyostelium discoideum AX4]|eukprot:XP_635267.1 RapGAP/RanGAP domain-containing protein [Dictyostelium discoideum AX4]
MQTFSNINLVKPSRDWRVEKGDIDENNSGSINNRPLSPTLFSSNSSNNNNNNTTNNYIAVNGNLVLGVNGVGVGEQAQSLDIAVENPEECILWYYNYFLGKSHQNYLGTLDNGDVFGASIKKEEYAIEGEYSYKTIIWTLEGIERQWFQLKKHASTTPTDIIKKALPRLQIKKIKEIDSPDLLKDFKDLEQTQTEINYKFGLLLARPNQSSEDDFYNNVEHSPKWTEFLNLLGDTVVLNSFKGYRGGLDVNNNTTGTHSLYTSLKGYEVMFHVSTMLPHSKADSQQIERKRHLGNDIVIIIFYDCDPSDPIIPWDPSTVNSNFNHIFAVVRPADENNYHVEIVIKHGIAKFGPVLPTHSIFPKNSTFKEFLITKLVNAQRAALNSAPSFATKLKRTFKDQLESIYKKHSSSSSSLSFVPKRRSSSVSNINKGRELKVKDPKYGSGFFKLLSKDSNKTQVFDTEILFSKSLNEKINCLDVVESDENNSTLIVATEESIYLLKSNMITGEQLFQKIIVMKDVIRLTLVKPLKILLVLTGKGLCFFEMDTIFQQFNNLSTNSTIPSSYAIPIPTTPTTSNNNGGSGFFSSNNLSNGHTSLRWSKSGIIAAGLINNNNNSNSINSINSNNNNNINNSSINNNNGGNTNILAPSVFLSVNNNNNNSGNNIFNNNNNNNNNGGLNNSSENILTVIGEDSIKVKKIVGTKGCTVYGYTKGDNEGQEEDITLLYVGLKKTLLLYEWNKGEFVKSRELPLMDNIKTLCAIAPGMICVGIQKEFLLIDIFTQTIKELYKKSDSEPVKALSLDNEILLCFNNIGIFVDESGNKTRQFELKWGSTPSSLALVPSYVLGISGPLIEVRTLLNGNIIQSLPANISLSNDDCNLDNHYHHHEIINNCSAINIVNNQLSDNIENINNLNINNNNGNNNYNNNGNNSNGGNNNNNNNNNNGCNNSLINLDQETNNLMSENSNNGAENVYSFSTFNDIAHVDNGNIYVASSSKGLSCILRIKQNIQLNVLPSPSSSPLKPSLLLPPSPL